MLTLPECNTYSSYLLDKAVQEVFTFKENMKHNKLLTTIAALSLLPAQCVDAQEIEVIQVIGSQIVGQSQTDPSQDLTLINALMPELAFTSGGVGGFSAFNERGTQSIHTVVYRNGVPVNDAGAGWYDFAHDMPTGGERVQSISGPNSVMYGNGSLAGTVFINDEISENSMMVRLGDNHTLKSIEMAEVFALSYAKINNGSVKTDNTENDWYENVTAKLSTELGQFTATATYTDYSYDYDDCWNTDYSVTNDCVQQGNKGTVSIRNDNLTFGYNFNNAEYFSSGDSTWESKAENFYFDGRKQTYLFSKPTVVGVTVTQEKYAGESRADHSVYATIDVSEFVQVGTRLSEDALVYRVGFAYDNWFASLGTSFRNPSIYELHGDAWTAANPDLDPEKAIGGEVGYGPLSVFKYDFSNGIDYSFANSQYINSGAYSTQGIRLMDTYAVPYGGLNVMLGYTDSDQPQVPEYKSSVRYFATLRDWGISLEYISMINRGTDYTGAEIDDVETINFNLYKTLGRIELNLAIRDLLNNEFEMTPGYAAGGRTLLLTITYK